jgi:hypothetical protein
MTTRSFSTRIRHSTDAYFQEWATELHDELIAAGLVQTSDTGQLASPVVAARGADGSSAGYWIFRFNDSLQGSAPIFLRVEPGTLLGGGNSYPKCKIQVGTGTDGAGTLTGLVSTNTGDQQNFWGFNQLDTDTAYLTLICHTAGFFGINYKCGTGGADGLFIVARTVDGSGTPTALGAIAVWGQSNTTLRVSQAFRFAATGVVYALKGQQSEIALGISPQAPTSSAVGSDFQAYLGYTITPQVNPLHGVCGVYDTEVPHGTTFSATLVGSTAHTYIGLRKDSGCFTPNANTGVKFAMLWE